MFEKYTFEKAQEESTKIRKEAIELKEERGEKGEPNKDDYEKAENKEQIDFNKEESVIERSGEQFLNQEKTEKRKEKSKQIAEEKLSKLLKNELPHGFGVRFMSGEKFLEIVKNKNFQNKDAEIFCLPVNEKEKKQMSGSCSRALSFREYISDLRRRTWDANAQEQTLFVEATRPLFYSEKVDDWLVSSLEGAREKQPSDISKGEGMKRIFWDRYAKKNLTEILSKPDVVQRNNEQIVGEIKEILENPDLIMENRYFKLVIKFLKYNMIMLSEFDWEKIRPNLQKDHYEVAVVVEGPFGNWAGGSFFEGDSNSLNWKAIGDPLDKGGRLLGVIMALRNNDLFEEIKDSISEAEEFACPVIDRKFIVKYPKKLELIPRRIRSNT